MKNVTWLISRYLITTILPFFLFSWLLLSVILFVQQAGRYADIFFSVNIPANLVWQLSIALIPSVIAFTCPMALLVGTIIGLAKMQGDNELVAVRAAGTGNLQIAVPIILLGICMSAFAFLVNIKGVPLAARLVRSVALQTAIKKLESPIEPGVFNTEVSGYTIYVKGGDIETGRWQNIFIHNEDKDAKVVRLITSLNGRIDTSGEVSELVLEDAAIATFPLESGPGKYISESVGEVRLGIKTKRGDLLKRLDRSELSPEELGLQQLSDYAASSDGKERLEAEVLWQRRILLSVTPLIFCVLGAVIVLRFNRGGRGFGIFVALMVLLGFFALAFLGEQLARLGRIPVLIGGLLPVVGSLLAVAWFMSTKRMPRFESVSSRAAGIANLFTRRKNRLQISNFFVDVTAGIRDFDLIVNLLKNFVLTLAFLASIFVIFTGFELWKYAGAIDGGAWLLSKYLFYLLPFVYLQIAPSAAMIATLATYVIKSRQNEIVTWTSAGQSVYRLLMPCFLVMLLIGGINWALQERVLPGANRMQDAARSMIRNRGAMPSQPGKLWIANDKRIYSFQSASDNEKPDGCLPWCARDLTVYEFADNGTNLQSVYHAEWGYWRNDRVVFLGTVEQNVLHAGNITSPDMSERELVEMSNPFDELPSKPTHMNTVDLRTRIARAESELERTNFEIALEKKFTTIFLPFIMALFTAPFALSLSRTGKAATVGYAIGLWLLFTGTSSLFEQLGLNGMLRPEMAVWAPLIIFSLLGLYLLLRVRT